MKSGKKGQNVPMKQDEMIHKSVPSDLMKQSMVYNPTPSINFMLPAPNFA